MLLRLKLMNEASKFTENRAYIDVLQEGGKKG